MAPTADADKVLCKTTPPEPQMSEPEMSEPLSCGHSVPFIEGPSGVRGLRLAGRRFTFNTPAFRARALCDSCRDEVIEMQLDQMAGEQADFSLQLTAATPEEAGRLRRSLQRRPPVGSGLMACGHVHEGAPLIRDGKRFVKLTLFEEYEDTVEGRSGWVCNACRDANIARLRGANGGRDDAADSADAKRKKNSSFDRRPSKRVRM